MEKLHSHVSAYRDTLAAPAPRSRDSFLEFSRHYRELEHTLRKARHGCAKQRRLQDPMMIYKEVERDRAEAVQSIIQQENIRIPSMVHHAHGETTIHLEQPLPAGSQCRS